MVNKCKRGGVNRLRSLWLLLALFSLATGAWAQGQAGGTVTDEGGMPLAGVSVVIKGTTTGTVTDADGRYSLGVSPGQTLVFSFIGFQNQERVFGGQPIDVTLAEEATGLDEVVVTALGIEREKKALGYAVQEVNAENLATNRTTSVANMLQGQVAGVQITQSTNGVGGSTRIVMRGLNSLGGNNQPLWVVDGIPINDDRRDDSNQEYGGTDPGGAASQLNPDDIESISVLKGANAAALYGSRAQNGAIIVTTKSGAFNQPLTFEYNGNLEFVSPYDSYDYQDVYGQGSGGVFNVESDGSWGPRMEGQMVRSWRDYYYSDGSADYAMLPGQNDFINDFYETGRMLNNSIVASAGSKDVRGRVSFTDSRNRGITPKHRLTRQHYSVSVEMQKKWVNVGAKGTYMHEDHTNNPAQGEFGTMMQFVKMPRSIRLQDLSHDILYDNQIMNYTGLDVNAVNPYQFTYEGNGNSNKRDRLTGQLRLTLNFTDWLKLTGRTSIDWYADTYKNFATHLASGSNTQSNYQHSRYTTKEFNADLLLQFSKRFNLFDVNANVGASVYNIGRSGLQGNAGLFNIPGLIYMNNGQSRLASETFDKKEIQSVYFSASAGFNSMVYVEVTGRNDWSSTLPSNNRSYFYPSVSLSAIVSEMLPMPEVIDYLKVRGSYAKVGNDTDPYQLSFVWSTYDSAVNGGLLEMQLPTTYPLADLKPESTKSFEVGLEYRMFRNRLGLDFTYYATNTTDQILQIATASSSGYDARMFNAGKVESKGVELMLTGTPIQTRDWKWDLTFNFGKNETKCVELTDQIKRYTLGSTRVASVVVNEGSRFGDIVASTAYSRDAAGNILIDDNGLPITETDKVIGNMTPDWTGSIGTTLTWRDLSLSALVDILYGGDFISMTDAYATTNGNSARSLSGRDGMVVPGIVQSTGARNTVSVTAETFWNRVGGATGVAEEFLYKRTNVKMREMSLGWTLPKAWMDASPFEGGKISLVGRDLFYFHKDAPVAAESAFSRKDSDQAFEYASLPPTRSMGFSLNVKF